MPLSHPLTFFWQIPCSQRWQIDDCQRWRWVCLPTLANNCKLLFMPALCYNLPQQMKRGRDARHIRPQAIQLFSEGVELQVNPTTNQTSFVYLIHAEGTDRIKIGISVVHSAAAPIR